VVQRPGVKLPKFMLIVQFDMQVKYLYFLTSVLKFAISRSFSIIQEIGMMSIKT
jgi:hypothetical protein